ncbi:MAG: UDP-N-acetylenolpyruvoylglucosamine reductase [Fimbriimonadales bacterium]
MSSVELDERIRAFRAGLSRPEAVRQRVSLRPRTTLLVGGPAQYLVSTYDADQLAEAAILAQQLAISYTVLGSGSNVLVSDQGVPGLVIHACTGRMQVGEETRVDCGVWFQDLFLAAAQAGLGGLEFAVGIPGTVGGALVSNAGAYRANIGDLVTSVEVVEGGQRKQVGPEWLEFSYRDSCLRRGTRQGVLVSVTLRLTPDDPAAIYSRASEFQRQRRMKQPPGPSAGSFFKNVYDRSLAERLSALPDEMKQAGVVPAGYLIMEAGLKGESVGGAWVSPKHANFLMNRRGASARDLRTLAELVKRRVHDRFGVLLEEEVLYLGDWT